MATPREVHHCNAAVVEAEENVVSLLRKSDRGNVFFMQRVPSGNLGACLSKNCLTSLDLDRMPGLQEIH